ncbi:MAG: glycosyltransferase [Caldilineaceae bacterium]|nr:glycosyltransferase [Caldilineaceae bacterium]
MRILQVSVVYYPELHFGGPPQKIHALNRKLIERGHEVRVLTFHSERPGANVVTELDGVGVRYLPWVGRANWRTPRPFATFRDDIEWAEVIHLYGLYNLLGPPVARTARRLGRPYLLEPQGMFVPRARTQGAKRLYHLAVTRWLARDAAWVIAHSVAEKKELAAIAPAEHIAVRRNGIDVEAFRNLGSGDGFRREIDATPDERIVLFIGRISPIKNLETLVRAFAQAPLPATRLALVGPLEDRAYVSAIERWRKSWAWRIAFA